MGLYINIHQEIEAAGVTEVGGVSIVEGYDKLTVNRINKRCFLELESFATLLSISETQLLELISYSQPTNEFLAFYRRDENFQVIRLVSLDGLNTIVRGLRGQVINDTLLTSAKNKILQFYKQNKKENEL